MPIIRSASNCRCSLWFPYDVEVEVFSAVVGLLMLTNKPTTAENTSTSTSYGNQRLQRQFDRLLMMGIVVPETF
jgi:hypothetical protein